MRRVAASVVILILFAALLFAVSSAAAAAVPGCPAGMRLVDGGQFTLADGSADHTVAPFCLDATEVTADQYGACVLRGDCPVSAELRCSNAATFGVAGRGDMPINCVTWFEAESFCGASGKRLPTEGEWEWAARGRSRAQPYPWGDAPPAAQACWDGSGNALGAGARSTPCPVGAHQAGRSVDGIDDLAGNVREWTSTSIGNHRVVRGGSWGDSLPFFVSAAFRGLEYPIIRGELTGFRCAADVRPQAGQAAPSSRGRPPSAS